MVVAVFVHDVAPRAALGCFVTSALRSCYIVNVTTRIDVARK